MTLDEAIDNYGAGVVYHPHPDAPREDGVITSVRGGFVHVRYRGDAGSKATAPEMLTLLAQRHACTCCGMDHGRPLHPGEHCDWCRRTPGHPLTPPPLCPRCATGRGDHNHTQED